MSPAQSARTDPPSGPVPAEPTDRDQRRAAVFAGVRPVLAARASGGPIRLRAPRLADVDAIIAACTDPESVRWTTVPHPYEPADAEFFIGPYTGDRWKRGEAAVFAITDAADAYAGSMELRMHPTDPAVADVGYLIAPRARGRGYAPAALRALCRWGFEALDLVRIEWRAYVGNEASRRVAEKAGFTYEGTCRSALAHRGERRDAWLAALLADDLRDDRAEDPRAGEAEDPRADRAENPRAGEAEDPRTGRAEDPRAGRAE
jgi:RimJ/RimL family protein N-acetyltransferase